MGLRPKAVLETVLYTDDLAATSDFYETIIGLDRVHGDGRMTVLRVSDENFLLLFKTGATTKPVDVPGGTIPPHDGAGGMHMAFCVDHTELARWADHLGTHDIALEGRVEWPSGETSLYFRDPAGNLVEIATPNLWRRR